jgi:hypothetical protein
MEELEEIIQNELKNVPERNREQWVSTCKKYAKLCLEAGDSIEKIKTFIQK